jgi:hypothetical protein
MIGVGTPRGLQDRPAVVIATLWVLMGAAQRRLAAIWDAASTYHGHSRPAHVTDHDRCQLVNDGDLHHGLLGMIRLAGANANSQGRRVRRLCGRMGIEWVS